MSQAATVLTMSKEEFVAYHMNRLLDRQLELVSKGQPKPKRKRGRAKKKREEVQRIAEIG